MPANQTAIPQALNDTALWLDAADLGVGDQKWRNRGSGGSALDAWMGSGRVAYVENGALNLWGTSGNYASVPDEAALDITGDIDIRVYVALADWTPSAQTSLVAKEATSSNRSYQLMVNTDGTLQLMWYADGVTLTYKISTASVGFSDGAYGWVRGVLDVDNGAGGFDVKFYTSTDGSSWSQLGTTVTTAGATSIYAGTSILEIGTYRGGTLAPVTGRIGRVLVLNGIGGSTVLDVDFSTASNFAQTFTCTTGQLVTIVHGASFVADGALRAGGGSVTGLFIADDAATSITGDIEVVMRVSLDDWTPPTATRYLAAKYTNTGNQRSWLLDVRTTGELGFTWSTDGTATLGYASSVATGFADGSTQWIKVTFDVNNGAGGADVKFWTAADQATEPSSWTQLGVTRTYGATTSIYDSTSLTSIGSYGDGGNFAGAIYRTIVRSGIGGTKVLDVDPSVAPNWCRSFPATTGQTVRLITSLATTNDPLVLPWGGENYVYLPGVSGNYLSVPDANNLDITGDLHVECVFVPDSYTPSADASVINKDEQGASPGRAWYINLTSTQKIQFVWWDSGSVSRAFTTTSAYPSTANGVKATLDVDNGAGGHLASIYYTTDYGASWTLLQSGTAGAFTTSVLASTARLKIGGAGATGSSPLTGKFYGAKVYDGIGGTKVLDINTALDITDGGATSFVCQTGQTVTVNRTTSGKKAVLVTAPTVLFGTDDYAWIADSALLDFSGSESFVAGVVMRQWATPVSYGRYLRKGSGAATTAGWQMSSSATTLANFGLIGDGTNWANTDPGAVVYTAGDAQTAAMIVDRSAQTIKVQTDLSVSTGSSSAGVGNTSNSIGLYVGVDGALSSYQDFELRAVFVARRALTAGELAQIAQFYGTTA